MSDDFAAVSASHSFSEYYQAEWKITNLMSHRIKRVNTAPFCPLSNLEIKFYFELWFQEYSEKNGDKYINFKFVLMKLCGSIVPASLKLKMEFRLEYPNDTLLKEYLGLPVVAVSEMNKYYFEDISVLSWTHYSSSYTYYRNLLKECDYVVLKCYMYFFDLGESPSLYLQPSVLSSIKTLELASGDIKSLKRSDEFSDIIIQIGSKLFFAHKAVLANCSPVFKQMIAEKSHDQTILKVDFELCDAFDTFMDYMYSNDIDLTAISWPILRDLYVLSANFEVDCLKEKCAETILCNLSVDKVSDILKVACDYQDMKLKEPAVKFGAEHMRDIISFKEWSDFVAAHPLVGYEVAVQAFGI